MAYYGGPHHDLPAKLRGRMESLKKLAEMPDRVTFNDLRDTIKSLNDAADALDQIMKDPLPGCVCRHLEHDDGRTSVVYSADCQHHRTWVNFQNDLKARYGAAEKKLRDEVRLKLVGNVLVGLLARGVVQDDVVKGAIAIADETIRQLTETP